MRFSEDTQFKLKTESFLSNCQNKERFIDMLSTIHQTNGINVVKAEPDDDILVVQNAIELAVLNPVIVIGEDTDILVLLVHHYPKESKPVILDQTSEGCHVEYIKYGILGRQRIIRFRNV